MTFPQILHLWLGMATRFLSPEIVAVEWVLCVFAALAIRFAPSAPGGLLSFLTNRFREIAVRKTAAIAISGILPVALRLSLLGIYPAPVPSIHDEFSHLLLADTLVHGRMSNPTHPMWKHFESIHIIQQPTYSSMYPPAQGIFLAIGRILFHHPWAGVLLSAGLMFAAMCWMMQQWMAPEWAFYGTIVAILRFGVFGPWISSYLGGPVSALGGALVIGAVPGLRANDWKRGHLFLFGLGIVILINSRPFEGTFLIMTAVAFVLPALARRIRAGGWTATAVALAPAVAVSAAGLLFTGLYSWRVTGNPLRMPYVVNRDTYGWPENLAFLPVHAVAIRHKVLRDMNAMEIGRRRILEDWNLFIDDKAKRLFENWAFFIGPLLTLPLASALRRFLSPPVRSLLIFILLMAFLNLFQLVLYPYHLGPVVAIIFALTALGLSSIYARLRNWRPAAGQVLAVVLPVCLVCAGVLKQNADVLGLPLTYWERAVEPHGEPRAAIERWLSARPRKQLVVVRYAPDHTPNQEWVYNRAGIDESKVVWAREMDPESDAKLLDYFKDREAWLLEADVWPQHVVHYSLSAPARSDAKSGQAPEGPCKGGCPGFSPD